MKCKYKKWFSNYCTFYKCDCFPGCSKKRDKVKALNRDKRKRDQATVVNNIIKHNNEVK